MDLNKIGLASSITVLVISVIALIFVVLSVIGFQDTEITAPALSFSIATSTEINVSFAINASNITGIFGGSVVNYTILNKSSFNGSYGILDSTMSLTVNASNETTGQEAQFTNFTASLKAGELHFIKINFTNVSRNDDGTNVGILTGEKIIRIDLQKFLLSVGPDFGKFNISLDNGSLFSAGRGHFAENMSFLDTAGDKWSCGVNTTGQFGCSK